MEVALPKVKGKGGAEEVRSDEFGFGQLGQFYKSTLNRPKHPKGRHQLVSRRPQVMLCHFC